MERGIGMGGMHIANLIKVGQWVGYLMPPRQNYLNLTSSTQLPKMSYLTLKLIGYCDLILLLLIKKMCHVCPPLWDFLDLEKHFNITVRIGPLRLNHIFSSFPLVCGAYCLACVQF